MHDRLDRAIYEWAAGVSIAWSPIGCHLLVAFASGLKTPVEAWAIDLVLVALTTAGLSVVALLSRAARGTVVLERIPAYCFIFFALNLIGFLFAGVLYGEVMTHPATASVKVPMCLLISVTAFSLYFEIIVVVAMRRVE
jgi:hypothetical protein